ncbi:hypothetical protein [Massilia sp. TWR1-2-2]|uniref:hypothetical protein n=1 Tax=Massilia sp. TWR1-2-2 TaxID=2804584 RepID=UPI003CF5D9FB
MTREIPLLSRKEAQERGQTAYFTGKPCRFKHVDYRTVASRACRACELVQHIAAQTDDPAFVAALLLEGDPQNDTLEYKRVVGTRIPNDTVRFFLPRLPLTVLLRLPDHMDGEPVTWGTSYRRLRYFTTQFYERLPNHRMVRRATPPWADLNLIKALYDERDRRSAAGNWVVDHIIPLYHPLVCGLHVHANLQLITMLENTQRRGIFVSETTVFSYLDSGWRKPWQMIAG